MVTTRRAAALAGMAVLIALSGGCSSSSAGTPSSTPDDSSKPAETSTKPAATEPAATETAEASPTPTVDPMSWATATVPFQDASGYTYTAQVSVQVQGPSSSDITNSKPGWTNWSMPRATVKAVLTNTTAGRNAPVQPIAVAAYWQLPAALCATDYFSGYIPPAIYVSHDTVLCPLVSTRLGVLQDGSLDPSIEIASGDSVTLTADLSKNVPQSMTEDVANALVAATSQPPVAWLATVHYNDYWNNVGAPVKPVYFVAHSRIGGDPVDSAMRWPADVLANQGVPACASDCQAEIAALGVHTFQ